MNITSVRDLIKILRQGKYTSVGSYPVYFITADGESLSFKAVMENLWQIARAIRDKDNNQWRIIAANINWEIPDLTCSHTNERIESAYAEENTATST